MNSYTTQYRDANPIDFNLLDPDEQETVVWNSKKMKGLTIGINLPDPYEECNLSDSEIEQLYDKVNEIVIPEIKFVYQLCNYKGEGLGFVIADEVSSKFQVYH